MKKSLFAILAVLSFAASAAVIGPDNINTNTQGQAQGQGQATPMAWGQPMPERCVTTFVWASPNSYPQHVYADPTCAKPWVENAVAFWNWFKEKTNGRAK